MAELFRLVIYYGLYPDHSPSLLTQRRDPDPLIVSDQQAATKKSAIFQVSDLLKTTLCLVGLNQSYLFGDLM